MAKELPYFKFHVSEWINGNITLEDYYTQGVFTNICAYYWFRSGNLTITELKRRLSKVKPTAFDSLIESGIISIENDFLHIAFLDEQLSERSGKSVINKANGSLGGRPKKTETKPNGLISETETKPIERREEQEKSERREYGPNHSHFVVVKAKYISETTCRINGKAGLIEYMEANQTILNMPEYGDKFMRNNNGKVFNELSHLQNAYSKFIELQSK